MKKIVIFLIIAILICCNVVVKREHFFSQNLTNNIQLNIEENSLPKVNDKFYKQWAIYNDVENSIPRIDINLLRTPNLATKDNKVLVAILDTGIDITHQVLSENIYTNEREIANNGVDDDMNGYIDDINGWDFVNNDNTVFDSAALDKHGTEVAGIISLVSNNPNVKILPLKVMEGSRNGKAENIKKAIYYAQKVGAKICNCSWSGFEYDQDLMNVMAYSDMLFVCAAGNSSSDIDTIPEYPSCYDITNLLNVASIDNLGNLSSFSNYGNKIHLAAPGENIMSIIPGNRYAIAKGTSISAPFVSGAAAILINLFPELLISDIINRIKDNVFKITQLKGKVTTGGLLDICSAIINDNKSLRTPHFTSIEYLQGNVTLYWTKEIDAISYEIEIDRDEIIKVNDTKYTYNDDINCSHLYRVRSLNGVQASSWSYCTIHQNDK